MTAPTVHLVPHTHRDREWYEPFQRFRLRPVDLFDEPDEFGQCAQILAAAGLEHACLRRGVPAAVAGQRSFRRTAPDGSSARCATVRLGT